MEWIGDRCRDWLRRYKALLLAALVGIGLLVLPEGKQEAQSSVPAEVSVEKPEDLEAALEKLLEKLSGAGKVEVLLSQAAGEEILYQVDERISDSSTQRDTVVFTGSSQKEKTGLVRQVRPPVYQGAVILCQGADDSRVKLAIVEAVKSVTGLSADKITVLKMK